MAAEYDVTPTIPIAVKIEQFPLRSTVRKHHKPSVCKCFARWLVTVCLSFGHVIFYRLHIVHLRKS